ncbi:MAG: N-acetyltransferase [Hyphomicrobiaceae bacterium]|nr:N-acetyltransferase [Hyphomicrobiaceae bacterium]
MIGFEIVDEALHHVAARENLLDRTMGEIRFRRSSERIREGRIPAEGLARIAVSEEGSVLGTVRLWDASASGLRDAVMLGPLAVEPEFNGQGIGAALMRDAIGRAGVLGKTAIVLVGDADYYRRFGFSAHAARRMAMPGPFERHRMLALELQNGALDRAHGTLKATGRRLEIVEALPLSVAV